MSQFFVPGPARISVGTGTAGALEYLGFSVDGVHISVQPRWDEVFSDLAGPAIGEDNQFLGADGVVQFVLSRHNAAVFHRVRAMLLGGIDGAGAAYSLGSLLRAEGLGMRLFIRATYGPGSPGAKAAYAGQRAVYNFPLCYPMDRIDWTVGIRPLLPRMAFRVWPDIQSIDGSWILFDDDATGEPAAN